MFPPEKSPVHQLVAEWWNERRPPAADARAIAERRLALAGAILEETKLKTAASIPWNPFADARCLWGAAYLSAAEDRSCRPHADLTARAAWHFDPPLARCGKDLATGAA